MRRQVLITAVILVTVHAHPAWANPPVPLPNGGTLLNVPVKSFVELRFANVVRQAYDVSCGAAAMATILQYYYGDPVSEQTAIEAMVKLGDKEKIQKDGFSLLELKRFALQRGYVSNGYRVNDVRKLSKLPVPVITLINVRGYNHFVVVKGVAGGEVFLADPAFGNRSRPIESFAQEWNGVIFVVFSETRKGSNTFTLDPTLKAPVNQVIPLIERVAGGVGRGRGEF